MNKENILERSRIENENGDEMDIWKELNSYKTAFLIIECIFALAAFILSVQEFFTKKSFGEPALMLFPFILCNVILYSVKYKNDKRRIILIILVFSVIALALVIISFIISVMGLLDQ